MAEVSAVQHEPPRFVLTLALEDGSVGPEAFVSYELEGAGDEAGDTVMDVQHTFVPPEYRGKGVAGVLVQAAFEYCAAESIKVRPSCTYISGNFMAKHPELADMVVES